MKYNLAVCGGTFDHFHKGHREFLRYGLSISRKLLIGLTTEKYIKAKNSGYGIESYKLRKQQLEKFLHEENAIDRVLIAPIDDIFIPKLWEHLPIEAIIVSENTLSGANEVNLSRNEQGKSPLNIETFQMIKNQNNEYISSSKIRNGEINREGKLYVNPLWSKSKLFITEDLRRDLKKPFGVLIKSEDVILVSVSASRISKVVRDSGQDGYQTVTRQARMTHGPYLITVGDVSTKTFNDLGLNQDVSVIDFKVARKKEFSSLAELGFSGREKIFKVNNPAGCLTPALFKAVSRIFKLKRNNRRIILQIGGEEDLSVLPLTLAAPLGSTIFYGQPQEGVVKVEVSERTKETAYNLVSRFKPNASSV